VLASADGRTLYVAQAEAHQLALVEVPGGRPLGVVALPGEPTGLALSPDGRRLYATCAAPRSIVAVIDVASRRIVQQLPAGHTATGPALAPDGKTLFVCNRFDNDVSVLDLVASKPSARVPVVREPVAAAVTPDGRTVVVANHLPAVRSDQYHVTPVVSLVDVATRRATAVALPDGATGLRGVCISPDGRYAFVTHIVANYILVPSHVREGWMNNNAVSVIDLARRERLNTVLLDELSQGAAVPWGVAVSPDGRWLCVTHAGTDELSLIDLPGMLQKLHALYPAMLNSGSPNNPGILGDLRRRIRLHGKGPRSVTVAGQKAWVAEYFSETLEGIALPSSSTAEPERIPLGPAPVWSLERRGEVLFNDAALCEQQWQSCASCHPDARVDGLNWDLLNDGVGNPKNTKSMLLSHQTPPSMALGVRATAEIAGRAGIQHILFTDVREEDAVAIDAYLRSLRPVPSPHLVVGRLSPSAERGKRLFQSARLGCARCHPAPLYTDLREHDVGTRNVEELHDHFDTPTLIEVWRTAPYLHDGCYTTVRQLFTEGRHGLSRGPEETLSQQDVDDLVEFVLSL
jgi:YVTN family beta-propeller protein